MDYSLARILVVLVVAWSGLLVGIIKWMLGRLLDRYQEHIDSRFEAMKETAGDEAKRWQALERELMNLQKELPNNYVRREDWIRFGGTIDAKMDNFSLRVDSLKDNIMHLQTKLGGRNG